MSRPSKEFQVGLLAAASVLRARGRLTSERQLQRHIFQSVDDAGALWHLLHQAQDAGDTGTALDIYKGLTAILKAQENGATSAEALRRLAQEPIAALHLADSLPARPATHLPSIPGRVVYLLNYALPQVANGYTLRAQAIASALKAQGLDLICLTRPGFPLDRSPPQAFRPADQVGGIEYLHEALPILEEFSGISTYLAAAADPLETRLRALRPQAVIAASNFQIALPALIAARRLGLPFYYEVRGFWEITQLSADPSIEASLFYQLQYALEARTAAQSDHVFTLGVAMRDELIRRGVPAKKITLAPNGCDTEKFTPHSPDKTLAARYDIPPNVPVIGYIGSFVQYEGLDDLIRACTHLRQRGLNFRLMLVGGGPAEDDILRAAADARLGEQLILPGRIPHAEVEAHYSLINIAPFPRKSQPVTELVPPLKPLEAMAMGKAVVVSSVQPLAEMLSDGQTGLIFQKDSTEDLARTLAQLITHPALSSRLGKAARAWVVTERSWKNTSKRIVSTISPGISKGKSP